MSLSSPNNQYRRVSLNKRPPLIRTCSPSLNSLPTLHDESSNNYLNQRYYKPKKSVRFRDNDSLENVRLFIKTQMPKACRSDPAYPKQYTYRLRRPNWPLFPGHRSTVNAVRMDDIQLDTSDDSICLLGSIQVANLAFEKHVVVHYTLDDWVTVQQMDASYREPVPHSANTWDRFCFKISLAEHHHQTLDFAIQYTVGGRVFWDNNENHNYKVEVIPDVLLDDNGSSSDDDDDNTFEDCIDYDEEDHLLIEQLRPLTLKEKPSSLANRYSFDHANQVKPLSPPLSPTTPVDMNPLWSVTTSNATLDAANNYFAHPKTEQHHTLPTSSSLDLLVSKYCFFNDPKQASVYTPYHSDPSSCTSKAIHS